MNRCPTFEIPLKHARPISMDRAWWRSKSLSCSACARTAWPRVQWCRGEFARISPRGVMTNWPDGAPLCEDLVSCGGLAVGACGPLCWGVRAPFLRSLGFGARRLLLGRPPSVCATTSAFGHRPGYGVGLRRHRCVGRPARGVFWVGARDADPIAGAAGAHDAGLG